MSQIPFGEIRAWVFQDAHGADRAHGGFLEQLTPDGGPTDARWASASAAIGGVWRMSRGLSLAISSGHHFEWA